MLFNGGHFHTSRGVQGSPGGLICFWSHPQVAPRGPAVCATSTLASFFSSGGFPLVCSRSLGLGLGLFFLVYPKPAQLN